MRPSLCKSTLPTGFGHAEQGSSLVVLHFGKLTSEVFLETFVAYTKFQDFWQELLKGVFAVPLLCVVTCAYEVQRALLLADSAKTL